MKKKSKGKVFVAMSGGVDSSVSAALLHKDGYDVTGVFIKAWQPPFVECTWGEDRRDAMRVARILGIPFLTFDLEKEYKKNVVEYMLNEYKKGRTPNPDVVCNEKIKFGVFFERALSMGGDYIATGHYARVKKEKGGAYLLYAGKDKEKDQSYFLWKLKQKYLSKTFFPVGKYEKKNVRKLALKFKLPVADKKDSQGLCFVGKLDFKDFLKKLIPVKKGKILNIKGEIIGEHEGVELYTFGERHGFTITKKTPNDKPYYVIGKNIKKNELVVSHKEDAIKSKKEISIEHINWIDEKEPHLSKSYNARIRYRQPLKKIRLVKKTKEWSVIFMKNEPTATPGQSLVVYNGEKCLGGGIISS